MLTLEQIKERLTESNLMAVSKAAGVHSNALYRLMNGGVKPSYETVKRLSDNPCRLRYGHQVAL